MTLIPLTLCITQIDTTQHESVLRPTPLEEYTFLVPNPANDKVNITCSYVINTCHVFTLDGREVEAVPVNDRYATLDVKGWVPGVYIVILHTHAGMVSRRLVVK